MVYLKSIDAFGFKSFAEHTNVQFDEGVTAIVGPNGSGKSNITDAIKWVLGEQSAKSLRGAKMEDIIFSGAEHRKAQNYAEVKLKLENSSGKLQVDSTEVTVTRRLYRSGESEYYLNNDRARLKDIIDLFLDSGLGKEAFSIISQGRVDEILNAKPIDRRQILEESAGVLKYKKRKATSVQKLDQTEDNLSRVEDILYDLEGRVEPLREEAAIAKEYKHLSKEMEKSDVLVTVHDIKQYSDNINELDDNLNHLKSQQATKDAEKVQHTQSLNKYKAERQQLDTRIESLNFELVKATEEVEKFTGQLNVLEERKRNQSETNARFEEEQESLLNQAENLNKEKTEVQLEIDRLKAQQKELNEKVQYLESQLYVTDEQHDEKLETIKDEYYQLMSEQSDVNNDIRFLEHTIQENESKQSRLDSRLVEAYEQLKHIQSDINEAEKQSTTTKKELKNSEQQLNEYERKLTQLKQQRSEYEEKLHQAYRFNEKLKSRIDSAATQQEEYSYFFNGVKHILKAKNKQLTGIRGAVAEVIQVPSDLTKAIEIALGASLQHVIVDSEKDGRQAIQYLKQNGLGRATFLPLNVIQPRHIVNDILNSAKTSQGFINIASEAIQVDSDYQNVLQNLLGNTIIVDELKNANELARKIRYRTRIVTLEGDIVNPGGSMTGGGDRKTKSILAQKDDLAKMRAQLEDYQQQTIEFEKQFQAIKEASDQISENYFETSQQYNSAKQRLHDFELELDRLRKSEAHLKDEHEEFEFEKNDGYQSETSKQTLTEKKQILDQIKAQLLKLEEDINLYTKLSKEGKASITQTQQQLHQKQSDLAVVKERLNAQKQSLTKITKQLESVEKQQEKLDEQIKLFNSDEMTGEKAFETIQSHIEQSKVTKEKLTVDIEDVKSRRLELNDTIEETDQKLQEANQDILSIENRYQDIKAEQSRLDVLINHAIDHLSDDYHLTYERASELYELDEAIDVLRKKVKLTKMSIEELGPVNLNAIEQFEEINTRYTFLDEQRADLRAAKLTLEQLIDEMDQEVKDRFKETFHAVQGHFADVFKSLFGGGQAELRLTDDDYLSAGVDIIVQPPGKKLQHLSLLSGGERALSAIALLFAILKVRSAPFVILDEVEAALDEANVIRYAQYLKELSDQTQFIVITHRKGTMEFSDRLYGVTMQESGVSKLVSVNLNTIDEVIKEEQV
ncbi:chromosome segregation protein SMC [Staphylococcus saprophyticus]|uniref:chromosome segregation protein SMC n=1 Tax=Staphylococcus TaxID=1279 RepID=UPI0008532C82|nr:MULTISPECIES: chromosome segregation protein SMC [Staphylococcus]MDT3924430.1 chromosome segregation protein SMC [Staphylococcus saprophyticus]MDW3929141.1 chromosome segregation protein SMC [Staphylococcus saprophyticus]MDW4246755.1 chromosome segregation protein SMC [Staphylococcus saprophyticus]MDW4274457.1 chromosome segregation protein SMC [Staphylococcus saprophyticus]MDW4279248.1 chromosome segregation protein SMC [Staphylococcus saprophyticus]